MAGSTSNFDDEIVGAGSDDGFDAVETSEWLKKTRLDIHKTVPILTLERPSARPINHETGELDDEVEYPNTYPNMEKLDAELESKRVHGSSSFHIQREILSRLALAKRIRERETAQSTPTPPVAAPAAIEEVEWPKADCKIVPACPEHFSQIVEIIQLESQATDCVPQVLDSSEFKIKDVERIAEYCKSRFRPFVVAINEPDDFTDASKWPEKSQNEYKKYMAWKKKQPRAEPVVVGFAFVMDPKLGFLLPKSDPGARFVGSIRLLIHPGHRRKQYGKALLDRILLSTAPYHRSLVEHGWHEPEEGGLVYEWRATDNQRQYAQLFIEVNTAPGDKDIKWKRKMLSYFDFQMIACFPKMLRTDRGQDSKDLNVEYWRMETGRRLVDAAPGEYLEPRA